MAMNLFDKIAKQMDKNAKIALASRIGGKDFKANKIDKKLNENIKYFVDNSHPVIRVHKDAYDKINIDGKFKNAFEKGNLNTWNADALQKSRKPTENYIFGKLKDSERPIYGTMEPNNLNKTELDKIDIYNIDNMFNEDYGNIKFYPKKDNVVNRSTFTEGDSEFNEVLPFALNTNNLGVLDNVENHFGKYKQYEKMEGEIDDLFSNLKRGAVGNQRYFETQIFGGLPLSDIERVDIPAYYVEKPKNKKDVISKQQAIDYANQYGYQLNLTNDWGTILECLANCPE